MARKGKNKKKQKKYSKKQFIEIVCSSCNICDSVGDPIFCYNSIYKSNPKRFPTVLKNLLNLRSHFKELNSPVSDLGIDEFAETFCNTGVCNNTFTGFCPILPECYDIFTAQVDNERKPISLKHRVTKFRQKHKGKRKTRYICHAYPTFFSSNNKKFKDTVERILNGDNVIKQNNNKKPAEEVKELSNSDAEGKKS